MAEESRTPSPVSPARRAQHMQWAATVKAVVESRCVDRGCEDDDATEAAETCEQYHRKDVGDYCDPCLMAAILGHAKEMEAQVDALTALEAQGQGWQPMETCPRNVDVLLSADWHSPQIWIGRHWSAGERPAGDKTRWRPLPPPPGDGNA